MSDRSFEQNIESILGPNLTSEQPISNNKPVRRSVDDYTARIHPTVDSGTRLNGDHPQGKSVVEIKSRDPQDVTESIIRRIPTPGRGNA